MKLLLTGFEPFGEYADNPSQWIVETLREEKIPGVALETHVLPVDYARAGPEMRRLIRKIRPEAVLALGLAGKSASIRLERVALNLNDSRRADNRGRIQRGAPIDPQAPAAYFSTLPLNEIEEALAAADIPVRISNHAGAYLCNHVFFTTMHTLSLLGLKARAGFVHFPLAADSNHYGEGLARRTLMQTVEIAIRVLKKTGVRGGEIRLPGNGQG